MNSTYLLSSAISATHYAVVTQIENATSAAEVDAVCRRELDRLRHRLEKGKGRVKDLDISEALVLLLFLENHRGSPVASADVDFALVHALNLAEGGESLKRRSLGYTYLSLNLRSENELSLLHFNSIVKDLASSNVGAMVQALRAVAHAPSADLAPAVQQRILHLVSHKSIPIRRLALAALGALSRPAPDALQGLRERKIWKRLRDNSPSVVLQAVKVLKKMVEHGYIGKSTATVALREVLDAINARRVSDQSHLDDSLLTCDIIEAMLDLGVVEDEEASPMGVAIGTAFRAIVSGRTKGHALALLLANRCDTMSPVIWTAVQPTVAQSIKTICISAEPNDIYFAFRSLEALPIEESGRILGDRHVMERVTAELQSEDAAIRKMALRILGRLSSDLPAVHLDRLVEALPHERDNLDPLAARAVEVADVIAAPLRSPQRGETFAASVNRIAAATVTTIVLEDLVQYVLGWLEEAESDDRVSFTKAALRACGASTGKISRTLAVLVCAVFCLLGAKADLPLEDACLILIRVLEDHDSPTLQQAALVSLAGVAATLGDGQTPTVVLDAVEALRERASRHTRGRCEAFLRVAGSSGGWAGLKPHLSDLSLPAVLQAMAAYARTLPEAKPIAADESRSHAASGEASRVASSTLGLRYDAYPAAPTFESRGKGSRKSASSRRQKMPRGDFSAEDTLADKATQSFAVLTVGDSNDPSAAKVLTDELWSPFESSPISNRSAQF